MNFVRYRFSMLVGMVTAAVATGALGGSDGRFSQSLACAGCMTSLGGHALVEHLKAGTRPLVFIPKGFAPRVGDFEKRWRRLRQAFQDSVEADYRSERAADLRRGGEAYYAATLYQTYDGRLRLATELSRRLAADGYAGGVPGPDCRGKSREPLMVRACAFGLALRLRGTEGQVEYYRRLNDSNSIALRIDFGMYLSRDGQFESAIEVFSGAAFSSRRTRQALPEIQALHYLANALADRNRLAKAEISYIRALDLRRGWSGKVGDDYWIDLSTTLNNAHTVLFDQGKFDAAESVLREALGIRMGLAAADPETYMTNVGVSLNNFSRMYRLRGKSAEAADVEEMIVAINRYLVRLRPSLYGRELARSLELLAGDYIALGRVAQAEAAALAAVDEYTNLIRDDSPFHESRARALMMHGELLLRAGDSVRGNRALDDAVSIIRYLMARQPQKPRHLLRNALIQQAKAFAKQGRYVEALMAIKEASQLVSPAARP